MKKRLLSAFLAVMMVLTMAPMAFAAEDTNTSVDSYDSLVEAINSASDGDTITLNGDIDVQQTLVVTKKLTLDLAGYKLYNANDLWEKLDADNWSLISVRGTGNLTITGNGTLPAKKNDCYAVDVQDKGASVTIENGTFVGNIHAVYVHDGTAFIKGGSYSIQQKYPDAAKADEFVLNCYDASRAIGVAKIIVSGGSFTGFNPASCYAEGKGTNFCAEEYTTQQEDTTYTVVKGKNTAVANAGANYNTVADAIREAGNGGTVTLLKDVTEDVVIPADKTVTLDLNGKKLTNVASHTIFNKGTLTINGNNGTVDNVTNGTAAVYNDVTGKVTINGGSYTRSAEASKDENNSGGNSWYVIHNYGIMNINKGTFKFSDTNVGAFSSLIHNGWYDGSKNTAQKNAVMTINDGDFTQGTGGKITVKNDDYGELEIKGGVFTQPQKNYYCILSYNIAKISGGTINGYVGNAYGNETCDKGDLTISDNAVVNGGVQSATAAGNDSSDKKNLIKITDNAKVAGAITSADVKYVSVSGGYFTTDPSAYVASGYVAGTSDVSGYSYKVVAKTNTGSVEVKPDVADPEVKVSDSISKEDQAKVAAAAATVSAPTLGAETGDIVKDINEDTAKTLIEKATTVQGNNKKLYVQSSLKVEPTAYNETTKTLALKITPQYRIVASTAATADGIELGDNGKNAEVVQDYTPMNITKATVVTMELPAGFAVNNGAKLSIQHTKSNGKVEYYTGTVTKKDNKLYLTFTTNGFSPFVISVPAAAIESKVYPTLQAAVDSAKNGDIIDLYKDVAADTKVTVAKTIKFEVATNEKTFAKENIVAGANTTVKVTGDVSPYTYEFTYTKPSSGGSSGGSSSGKTTYKVTTSAVNNGGVNASPSNAEKGATITITLSPDKGYKLDKLTVTDGSGKTVSTVKKSDTVYTFTMPASAVKVGVSYVKATETPSETKFNDVSANDWFASAVDYVTGKGMMNGTADNTFSPKANTTRGMVVTVLYRLENQPSTSAASFTDVASGAYYANAVAWANANGIVSGYGSGKFGPNDKVTREQLAAILYRYAQYKKYDVSVGEDTNILSYDDAQSISSYAIPAIQWACGAGVVTGKSGSKLDPKGNATRAEVAAMLMRFCENVK